MTVTDLTTDPVLVNAPVHEGYKILGGVVLYQKLGQGGMGAVYRGRHLRLNVDVAVKVMAQPAGLPADQAEAFVKRFIREAQTTAAISHQNLIRVIDVNTEAGVYYLVMDYIDGESAGDRVKRKERLTEEEAVEIVLGAADGLAEAHRGGIVHRDVKPDNIMIDKEGRVRVADLGLAKAFSAETDTGQPSLLTQTQAAMGTPYFMSPEQFMSARDVGPPADVWSLGVTLYQILTGRLPWTDSSVFALAAKIQTDPLPGPKEARADLSDGVCEIIRKAVRKDASERYADCGEMGQALRRHLDAIRSSDESALPDAAAGATSLALASMAEPPLRTMSLIAEAALGRAPTSPTIPPSAPATGSEGESPAVSGAAPPARRQSQRGLALAAGLVGAAAVVAVLAWALLGREEPERDPLEAEAQTFYERLSEAAASGEHEEVVRATRDAAGRYDDTSFGMKIKRLEEAAARRVAEKARKEAAKKKAAFDACVAAADAAQGAGNLYEAIRQLKLALAELEDAEVSRRLAALELLLEARRLLAEGEKHEEASEWDEARADYEKASKIAEGEDRERALTRLAEVGKRIRIEEAVAAVEREADAGRWRKAWDLLEGARKAGLTDARLDELSRRAVEALAPAGSLTGALGIELVLVRGGKFRMGTDAREKEAPSHEVTVSGFYVGRFEVTKAEFEAFRRGRRSLPRVRDRAGREPAVSVSWQEAVEFCKYLSRIDRGDAVYRLPTEAEWEFAARGTAARAYPWGDDAPTPLHANLAGPDDGFEGLAPAGSFPKGATPEGVMDMPGNAYEWCADWYGPYGGESQTDPVGPMTGRTRVIRGGAFYFDAASARASARGGRRPGRPGEFIGFRVVRELADEEREFLEKAKTLEEAGNE